MSAVIAIFIQPRTLLAAGALALVRRERPLSGSPGPGRDLQSVAHPDLRDPQHAVHGRDVAFHGGRQAAALGWNLVHLQCAGEGAEQSTTDGGNDVVESRRQVLLRLHAVETLDSTMDAEANWRLEILDVRVTDGPLDFFQPYPTGVDNFSHSTLLV